MNGSGDSERGQKVCSGVLGLRMERAGDYEAGNMRQLLIYIGKINASGEEL